MMRRAGKHAGKQAQIGSSTAEGTGRMRGKARSKAVVLIKNLTVTFLVIAFFVSIIMAYYKMLVEEKRRAIIKDGEMSAWQVEAQFNEYLATSVDAIKLSAYTLEGMVAENRSGEEILNYLIGQSTAVINAIFENTMGVYGYINGGYYDGAGWVPDEGFEPKTRPWYVKAASNNGEVTLIDPYVDAQSGTVMMSLSMMLSDQDSVVAMDIYLDRIQEITEDAVASGLADVELILDAHDMVIAHSDRGEVGKAYGSQQGTFAAAMMETLNRSEENYFEFFYGNSHYIAYQARLQNDWRCLSVTDATDVFKPLKRILSTTVVIVAVVTCLLAVFMAHYNRKNRAIENLTEETKLDKLTGFLNKAGTAAKLPELCRAETGMLAILDLDSFKLVNDLHGHDMGDKVLSAFASIVRQNTRAEDVLCRIGGDEFVIFCRNVTDDNVVAGLARRLNDQLVSECRRLMGADFDIPIGVSVGAVAVPSQGRDYQLLFPLADRALYQVKQNGKHGSAVYDASLNVSGGADSLDGELARITQILDERGDRSTALWLGQGAFSSVYRFLLRSLRQSGGTAAKLLFLVSAAAGESEAKLPEAADRFSAILDETLGTQDVILQSKPTEFLVLLRSRQNAREVADSILAHWQETEGHERYVVTFAAQELSFPPAGEA